MINFLLIGHARNCTQLGKTSEFQEPKLTFITSALDVGLMSVLRVENFNPHQLLPMNQKNTPRRKI